MILVSKDVWINQKFIVKVKKDENGLIAVCMSNNTIEILDTSVLSLEDLLYMLESGG